MSIKRILLLITVLTLFAASTKTVAQSNGPTINRFELDPSGGSQVGSTVTIHISVASTNPGATKITVTCGGVDKIETSEVQFDSHWNTSGCGSGSQSVTVCARSVDDPQWQHATCATQGYNLSGSSASGPTADFWADIYDLQPGQCTTMHWRTGGATSVNIDGKQVDLNGDQQICPNVTTKYSLRASGQGVDATRNFSVQVGSTNYQPPPDNGNSFFE